MNARTYYSYAKAQAIVKRLGISSSLAYREYCQNGSRDMMMPSDPAKTYAADWKGWAVFCGKPQYSEKYATLKEASRAAQALGISTKTEYKDRCYEDAKLPVNPEKTYKNWVSWPTFLGGVTLYPTYRQARTAARKLGCRTKRDYDEKRSADPRLPSSPDGKYDEWVSWATFLG